MKLSDKVVELFRESIAIRFTLIILVFSPPAIIAVTGNPVPKEYWGFMGFILGALFNQITNPNLLRSKEK